MKEAFVRNALRIVEVKKLSTNMAMLRFAFQVKKISIAKQVTFQLRTKFILLRGVFRVLSKIYDEAFFKNSEQLTSTRKLFCENS